MSMFTPTSRATMQRLVRENLTGRARFTVAGDSDDTGEVYDPYDGDFEEGAATPGTTADGVVLRAERLKGDPVRYASMGLNVKTAITLRVEGIDEQGEVFKPAPGMLVIWPAENGEAYAVNAANPIEPQGTPILYIVDAGG